MIRIGAAILVLAGILGARAAAREIATPFEGFDKLAQARTSPAPGSLNTAHFGYEIPPVPLAESASESGDIVTLPSGASGTSELPNGIQVIYLRDEEGLVEVFTLEVARQSADLDIEEIGLIDIDERNVADSFWKMPTKTVWDRWREQAIADLPEHLRNDSDHRRAIDRQYHLLSGSFVNTADDWNSNRPPVGGYDIGGVGFTDIDERADPTPPTDLETQKLWAAYWQDWRNRAIAALPEAERNDPNRLKEIDTTLERIASHNCAGPSWQELQWNKIAYEAMISQKKAQVATK